MLEVKNVDIVVSTRFLVRNLSFTLNKGDKLAIIGEEGNGKSTLLKCLINECSYAEINGIVNFNGNRVGYLEQFISGNVLDLLVSDYLFSSIDYYDNITKFYKLSDELGIDDALLDSKMKSLSGGENVKIRILKLLLDDPDILFLDEPTNDLDIKTLEWLEKFINGTDKPIVFISHDETLLSYTANMILHIEQIKKKTECKHTLLKVGYDEYVDERLRSIEHTTMVARNERRELNKKQEKLDRIMKSVHYKQNTISRADPHGGKVLKTKMKALKSQEAKLDNVKLTDIPDPEESIYFEFSLVSVPNNKGIIDLKLDKLCVQDKVLSTNIELSIVGPKHICIIGDNGVGKSTLIKLIYEMLRKRTDISIGYMPQVYDDVLSGYTYVLDYLSKNSDDVAGCRSYLGNMNFTRDEMTGKIRDLSNGSKAKLFLTKLVRDKCNVLILDEPTRNVSPLSNPVIRSVLKEFKGTIISISHDRKYIDEVASEVYVLTKSGLNRIK